MASLAATLGQFQYSALEDARTQIRLVEITRIGATGQLECHLTTWSRNEAPRYRAISYTWGDASIRDYVKIGDLELEVAQSCQYALQQAHWHGPGHLWIDAICINQDNNDEKNHQVQMMGDIFKAATSVIACIGPHSEVHDTRLLMRLVASHKDLLTRLSKELTTEGGLRVHVAYQTKSSRTVLARRLMGAFLTMQHSSSTLLKLSTALTDILERPYFARVWVAQELFVSQQALLCCGQDQCPCPAFEGLRALLLSPIFGASKVNGSWARMPFLRRVAGLAELSDVHVWHELLKTNMNLLSLAGSRNMASPDLELAIHEVSKLQCKNPKDTVYGILGLLRNDQACGITVDYKKPAFELAVEVWSIIDATAKDAMQLTDTLLTLASNLRLRTYGDRYLEQLDARRPENRWTNFDSLPDDIHRCRVASSPWFGWRVEMRSSVLTLETNQVPLHDLPVHLNYHSGQWADLNRSWFASMTDIVQPILIGQTIIAAASGNIRPGDWILFKWINVDGTPHHFGIVLRECPCLSQYAIVGKALWNERKDLGFTSDGRQEFDLSFDVEDLLVFWAHMNTVFSSYQDFQGLFYHPGEMALNLREQVRMYFSIDICYAKDSSYATIREPYMYRQKPALPS